MTATVVVAVCEAEVMRKLAAVRSGIIDMAFGGGLIAELQAWQCAGAVQ